MSVMTCFVFMSVILGYNFVSGSYYQPNPTDQSSTVKHPAGQCVVQQICHGGPSPEAFSELVSLVKEMKKKLEVMESKLDAVCDGKCHSKRGETKVWLPLGTQAKVQAYTAQSRDSLTGRTEKLRCMHTARILGLAFLDLCLCGLLCLRLHFSVFV